MCVYTHTLTHSHTDVKLEYVDIYKTLLFWCGCRVSATIVHFSCDAVCVCVHTVLSPHHHMPLSVQICVFQIQLKSPCQVTVQCLLCLHFHKPDQIYCPYCSSVLTGRDVIKNGLHLSLLSHSFSFSKYDPSFLGKWDLEEQTRMHHLFFLSSTTELTHPVCHLSIMTLWIVSQSVPPSLTTQPSSQSLSLTQSSGF